MTAPSAIESAQWASPPLRAKASTPSEQVQSGWGIPDYYEDLRFVRRDRRFKVAREGKGTTDLSYENPMAPCFCGRDLPLPITCGRRILEL